MTKEQENEQLRTELRKRSLWLLALHSITSKGLGTHPVSTQDLQEINRINAEIMGDLHSSAWEL